MGLGKYACSILPLVLVHTLKKLQNINRLVFSIRILIIIYKNVTLSSPLVKILCKLKVGKSRNYKSVFRTFPANSGRKYKFKQFWRTKIKLAELFNFSSQKHDFWYPRTYQVIITLKSHFQNKATKRGIFAKKPLKKRL